MRPWTPPPSGPPKKCERCLASRGRSRSRSRGGHRLRRIRRSAAAAGRRLARLRARVARLRTRVALRLRARVAAGLRARVAARPRTRVAAVAGRQGEPHRDDRNEREKTTHRCLLLLTRPERLGNRVPHPPNAHECTKSAAPTHVWTWSCGPSRTLPAGRTKPHGPALRPLYI